MIVSLPLEQTRLIAARGGFDASCEQTEVRFCDVQREVSSRAQLHLRPPLVVLCKQDQAFSNSGEFV